MQKIVKNHRKCVEKLTELRIKWRKLIKNCEKILQNG